MSQPAVGTITSPPLTPPLSAPAFRATNLKPPLPVNSDSLARPVQARSSSTAIRAPDKVATLSVPSSSPSSSSSSPPPPSSVPHIATSSQNAHGKHSRQQDRRPTAEHDSIHDSLSQRNSSLLKSDPQTEFSIQRKPQDRDPSLMRQTQVSQEEAMQAAHRLQDQQPSSPRSHAQRQVQSLQSPPVDQRGSRGAHGHTGDSSVNGHGQDANHAAMLKLYEQRNQLVLDAVQAARESGHQEWIVLMDLSRFASQHHMSPYSIMKFGPRGSPFAYVPITLQRPDAVEQTMLRQRESERLAVEWLINKKRKRCFEMRQLQLDGSTSLKLQVHELSREPLSSSIVGTKRAASALTPPAARATSLLRTHSSGAPGIAVQDLISEAMSDSIREIHGAASNASSSTESLSVDHRDPGLKDLNQSTELASMGDGSGKGERQASEPLSAHAQSIDSAVVEKQPIKTGAQAGSSVQVDGPLSTQEIYVQELEKGTPTTKPAHPPPDSQQSMPVASLPPSQQASLAIKTSDTHPIHISPIVPENLLPGISEQILRAAPTKFVDGLERDHRSDESTIHQPVPSFVDPLTHQREQALGRRLIRLPQVVDLVAISTPSAPGVQSQAQIADQATAESQAASQAASAEAAAGSLSGPLASTVSGPCIGNLLLSSCPGKKVRLSGPVRGRGAICRDLGLDLKRVYDLGIRAIVCCLDDEELAYLGAPWMEYEREADSLGLDVIRLPMAEGFAPTCVARMDDAITALIQDYTLRGRNVLVHCRGGVGRAGLTACAWMLKLGLVGPSLHANSPSPMDPSPVSDAKTPMEVESRLSTPASLQNPQCVGEGPALPTGTAPTATLVAATDPDRQPPWSDSSRSLQSSEHNSQTVLDTVERLIETIRRRRSPKAIETAEQVKFIVDFVTYLHRQERLALDGERATMQ